MHLKIILRENQRENQHANEQSSDTSNIGHITNKHINTTQKTKWLDEQYGPTFTYISTTQLHDRSLFWFSTGTSIKRGGIKLALWIQTSPLII